jgi:transposase
VIPLIPWITCLEAAMMGRLNRDQGSLFYAFRLDDRVPKDHLLRRIDVFVTAALGGMHARLEPYYSEIGRPSIDPELMIRMLIIGYCYGLRSERRLTQEVDLHLAYRWFCGFIGSGRAMCFVTSLNASLPPAWRPAWSRAKASPSMPV